MTYDSLHFCAAATQVMEKKMLNFTIKKVDTVLSLISLSTTEAIDLINGLCILLNLNERPAYITGSRNVRMVHSV